MGPGSTELRIDRVGDPLLGPAAANLRFELTQNEAGKFVSLDDSGRFSRILRARIAVGEDETLRNVALKIQRDRYGPLGAAASAMTNVEVDDLWRRELEAIRAAAAGDSVVRPIDLGPGQSLPILYCKRTDRYLHPVCGESGQPLTVCTDDDVLSDAGLKEYSKSLDRYLRAPNAAGAKGTFYKEVKLGDESPRDGVRLRFGSELYRDWSKFVHREDAAESRFACATCTHRADCYPNGADDSKTIPAESHLVPVSFYDFYYVPMEPMDLSYEEVCDLLGGRVWTEVEQLTRGQGCDGRERLVQPMRTPFSDGPQFLFAHDEQGMFPLEVLWLKLSAFAQVCEGVREVHTHCQRPHFDLTPKNVMAHVRTGLGDAVPSRWGFEVRLVDLGSPTRFLPKDQSRQDVPQILMPGPEADQTFLTPLVSGRDGDPTRMPTRIQSRDEVDGRVRMVLEAEAVGLDLGIYRPGDIVRVWIDANAWLWCELADSKPRLVTLAADLSTNHPCADWGPPKSFDASLSFFRSYGPPCDLYGLGMLLFRTLLVNDSMNMIEVRTGVERCLQQLKFKIEHPGQHVDDVFCRGEIRRLVREYEQQFHPLALLYSASDRARPSERYDRNLWEDVMVFGFQLTTNIAGFSFADSHADRHPNAPGQLMGRIIDQVGEFLTRIRVEMFARDARDTEIGDVCAAMLDDVRHQLAATLEAPDSESESEPDTEPESEPNVDTPSQTAGEE